MIEPFFNKVIVRLAEDKQETELDNGLILPPGVRPKPKPQTEGYVVSLGSGGVTKTGTVLPHSVEPGDRVILQPKQGATVEICGESYIIIPEEHIDAIVTEDD